MNDIIAVVILACLIPAYFANSAYIVNCPSHYHWDVQYHMCIQQNYCGFGSASQVCSINYTPFVYQNYYPYYHMYYHYSACQAISCPCFQTACQHIQTCYSQIPCYWNLQPITTTPKTFIIVPSTPVPTLPTTVVPTTTEKFDRNITSTPHPPTRPTWQPTTVPTTTEWIQSSTPCPTTTSTQNPDEQKKKNNNETLSGENNEIDIKISNTINSHNYIHSPVSIYNTNDHSSSQFINITQTVISNSTKNTVDRKCCSVYSPKLCIRKTNSDWYCYHRKYRRCGTFCYREIIYLRPRHIEYHPPVLVMPPRRSYTYYSYNVRYHSTIDCSGCVHGGYHCSTACYSYRCSTSTCGYIDHYFFCDQYGGHGCSTFDGYFDNDYY